ncbi:hypothetical protein KVR01_012384 [Diaporthe batatas]|uniref:uncharacterized protein n=1 Tax=Diaporthe batatas TaxID=748121 RepID=UPI001D0559C1|nr:uncharacterized protein KVR01_012384 [Diaporthe batatas]KAG8157722.1 hypothetical protein KVR01_012384 [Diaporthe batatas]
MSQNIEVLTQELRQLRAYYPQLVNEMMTAIRLHFQSGIPQEQMRSRPLALVLYELVLKFEADLRTEITYQEVVNFMNANQHMQSLDALDAFARQVAARSASRAGQATPTLANPFASTQNLPAGHPGGGLHGHQYVFGATAPVQPSTGYGAGLSSMSSPPFGTHNPQAAPAFGTFSPPAAPLNGTYGGGSAMGTGFGMTQPATEHAASPYGLAPAVGPVFGGAQPATEQAAPSHGGMPAMGNVFGMTQPVTATAASPYGLAPAVGPVFGMAQPATEQAAPSHGGMPITQPATATAASPYGLAPAVGPVFGMAQPATEQAAPPYGGVPATGTGVGQARPATATAPQGLTGSSGSSFGVPCSQAEPVHGFDQRTQSRSQAHGQATGPTGHVDTQGRPSLGGDSSIGPYKGQNFQPAEPPVQAQGPGAKTPSQEPIFRGCSEEEFQAEFDRVAKLAISDVSKGKFGESYYQQGDEDAMAKLSLQKDDGDAGPATAASGTVQPARVPASATPQSARGPATAGSGARTMAQVARDTSPPGSRDMVVEPAQLSLPFSKSTR